MPDKSTARRRGPDMAARMAAVITLPKAEPAEPEPATEPQKQEHPKAARAERPAPAARTTPARPRPMPAEQPRAQKWDRRIPFTTNAEQDRALKQARLDDGIQATARIRAMVALWMEDERHRARVDKLAKGFVK